MSFKSFIRNLFGHNRHIKPHTDGMKRLHDDFPAEHPGRACIRNIIRELLEGEIELVKIPQTDRFDVPPTGTRQTWANQLDNQVIKPLQYMYPESLFKPGKEKPLVEILQFAKDNNLKVKPAGSGHSYSDCATTTDVFINTHGLCKVASTEKITSRNIQPGDGRVQIAGAIEGAIQQDWLAEGVSLANAPASWPDYNPEQNRTLVEMQCGIRLHYLNEVLDKWDLGLENMGGYDGQTIVGATMTATHGTGFRLPPFPDSVRSLVLCTTSPWTKSATHGGGSNKGQHGDVYLYRIESASAPVCDPAKYDDSEIALIQDDDAFHAAICSMGCFGVIYSFTIEVMQKYWLEETRELTTLDKVMTLLKADPARPGHVPAILDDYRHVEFLVHPYPLDEHGKVMEIDPEKPASDYYPYYHVILEHWKIVEPGTPNEGHRNWLSGFLGKFNISFDATATIFYNCPSLTPMLLTKSMQSLEDKNHVNVSHKIFVNGMSQYAGFANEIAYKTQDNQGDYTQEHFEKAINRIHLLGQSNRRNGDQYQTSPFSVRFVKQSKALFAMQNRSNSCMIEMDLASGTYGGTEILARYQMGEYEHGGIPHWGLEFDLLTGSNGLIKKLYPDTFDRWLEAYLAFNADGRFDNSFTNRLGFSKVDI